MPQTQTQDYYSVLGVPDTASAEDLKKAYRKLAKQHHPDANRGSPAAQERFKAVSEAYAVLGNEEKRKQYDEMRRLGAFGGFDPRRARTSGAGAGGPDFDFDLSDLQGLGGFGDIFSQMFGGRRQSRTRSSYYGPERGADRVVSVRIPLRAAVLGETIRISVELEVECPVCKGKGAEPGSKVETCPQCGGVGTLSFSQGAFAVNRPCPKCGGRGEIIEKPCKRCGGEGVVEERRTLAIKIPPGTEDGDRIRLKGQGNRTPDGGPPGDLILEVSVDPDRFFKRRGLDLITEVPLNLAQALLGSKLRVRTIRGGREEVKIPPGTQSGAEFRLPGQGVERRGRKGDQVVRVNVKLPDNLSEDERKKVEELAASKGMKY